MENRYDSSLLPAIREIQETWTSDQPCGLWDFVNYRGDMQLGYAFASLFVPEFVEAGGAVILAEQFDEQSFQRWRTQFDGDLGAVERMMNHLHISDLFLNGHEDHLLPDIVARRVGEALQITWASALRTAFPGRSFVVTYEPDDPTGSGEVTFFLDRSRA